MSKPKLYLGTIFIDRGAVPAYYYSLLHLERSSLVDIHTSFAGHGDGAMRQLNVRVDDFLRNTTCDYFWLQGNDTDFQPGYIESMARHGKSIVGGLVPIKQVELRWGYQALSDAERKTDLVTGLVEVRSCILESILIRRDVFTDLEKMRPDLDYRSNTGGPPQKLHHHWRWELAGPGAAMGTQAKVGANGADTTRWEDRILQSEDYLFCDDARAAGHKIYLDTTGYCGHWDCRVRFPLVPPEPAGELVGADGQPLPPAPSGDMPSKV